MSKNEQNMSRDEAVTDEARSPNAAPAFVMPQGLPTFVADRIAKLEIQPFMSTLVMGYVDAAGNVLPGPALAMPTSTLYDLYKTIGKGLKDSQAAIAEVHQQYAEAVKANT